MSSPMGEILEKLAVIVTNQDNQQKLLEKHSTILEDQGRTLLRNTITVEDHHKRSTQLELRQDKIEDQVIYLRTEVQTTKSNKQYLKEFFVTLGYVAAGLPAVGGVLWGLYQLAQKLGL